MGPSRSVETDAAEQDVSRVLKLGCDVFAIRWSWPLINDLNDHSELFDVPVRVQ